MTIDYGSRHPSLRFDRPAAGVLRITLDAPGLNAVTRARHRDLVRNVIDCAKPINSAIHGAGLVAGLLADEFYGFGEPDAREGLNSHREKRAPRLEGPTSEWPQRAGWPACNGAAAGSATSGLARLRTELVESRRRHVGGCVQLCPLRA